MKFFSQIYRGFLQRAHRIPPRFWVIGGGLLCVFFAAGFIAEKTLEGYAASLVQRKLLTFKQKTGVPIEWKSIDASWGSIEIVDIAVGESHEIIVDRVRVFIGLNPASSTFLRPSRVAIGRILVKESVQRSERLDWIKRTWSKWQASRPQKTEEGGQKTPSWLPPEIQLNAATIVLANGNDEHTRLVNLGVTADLVQKKIRWRAKQVVLAPFLDEVGIDGSFVLQGDDVVAATMRARAKESGTFDWKLRCLLNRVKLDGQCEIDAKSIPQTVLARLQPHFGSSFAPGLQGTVTLAQLKTGIWRGSFDGDVSGVVVEHKSLSIEAVGPFDVGARFGFDFDPRQKRIVTNDLKVALPVRGHSLKSVALALDVDLRELSLDGKKYLEGSVRAELPPTECDNVLKVVPKGFAPDLEGFKLGGQISGSAHLTLGSNRTDLTWGKTSVGCVTEVTPEMYTSNYLNGPFMLERTFGKDKVIHIPVDPKNSDYTPLADLPGFVVSTFVTSEDAGFWNHNGIEPAAIEQALERNAKEGRAVVGGSTITMQTVKNLFLSRDKTIARKVQEIFLAWHLERTIGKKRILEIYFNIVEFGPELYGIGKASERFFAVRPNRLSAKQAAYLASLLPAPVPRYQYFCRGSMTENYKSLVDGILQRMLALGRINSLQYASSSNERIRFADAEQDETCAARRSIAVKTGSEESPSENSSQTDVDP